MITFIRTAVGMSGKALELAAFAKEMTAIINRVTGGNTTACVSFGGNANAVAWISHADSFTQMEETLGSLRPIQNIATRSRRRNIWLSLA